MRTSRTGESAGKGLFMGSGKRWLRVICVCAMLCVLATLLAAAAENPEDRTVESLLKSRVTILNSMLTGNITCDEGQEQLKKVETDALYTKDIENIRAYDASDYDAMEKMEILSLKRKGKVCDILHYEAEIRWNCVGYDGAYVDAATYQIGVSCKDDEYRLISIEIL